MKNTKLITVIILTALTNVVLNMAHPVTPKFIIENNLPSYMFGVFFAAMSLGNFIFSPIWGKLSDKGGRIKYMIIGIFFYGVAQVGFGFSTNPAIIVIWRFIGGSAVISYLTVSLAYISDITNTQNRLKGMMYYSASTAVGGAFGSLLGGLIGNSNYKVTFLVQFLLSVFMCIMFFLFLSETIEKRSKEDIINKGEKLVISKALAILMILVVIFYFASTSYNSSINYYIEAVLKLSPSFIGVFLSIAGIIAFLSNLILTSKIGRIFGEKKALYIMGLSMCIFIGTASLMSNTILFLIFILLFVGCSAIYQPLLQNLISKSTNKNNGKVAGLQNSSKAIGMILGSLYSGFMFSYGNKIPFITAAIVVFIGVILSMYYYGGGKNEEDFNN